MTEPLRQGEALFSIAEAAAACGVSKRTIRRRLDEGRFPNRYRKQDATGSWVIPLRDLYAAGLKVKPSQSGGDVREPSLVEQLLDAPDQISSDWHTKQSKVLELESQLLTMRSEMEALKNTNNDLRVQSAKSQAEADASVARISDLLAWRELLEQRLLPMIEANNSDKRRGWFRK